MTQRLIVGVDRPYIHDLRDEISGKQSLGADYFVAPLVDACYGKGEHLARIGSSIESGRGMESRDWITNIVGKISDWIDLDSSSVSERQASLQALQEEIAWASYLSLQAIFLPTPRFNSVNYARALMQAFTGYQQFYIRIPMLMHFQESVPTIHDRDGWLLWDGLRQHIGDAGRYFVALELCEECENISTDSIGTAFVSRWCAEPVKMLVIPTQLFQLNSAGYPVLTKRMQQILGLLLPHCSQIMLTGESTRECGSYVHYAQYLRHLVAQGQAQLSNAARHVQGYEDTLQAPLQPLMDNLEAQTYETFEKDPMKYFKYEEGITKAIQHFHKKRTLERNSNDEVILVLTVVGAGRGPLVAAALSASANTGIPLRIYAVEKNPNAVVILRSRVQSEVWSNVTVVDTDMRDWQPPELCDVMVSELLGSFGDNELSPECLDGAQKCLRSDGVSIPQSYTSYIAPIATSKLWNMAKGFNLSNSTIADGLNVAYVVRFHSSYQFAEAKPLFTFAHPNFPKEGTKIDNTRYGEVSFVSEANMVLHGLAGYFETVLFDPRSVASDTVGSSTRPPGLGTSNSASDELDRVMLSTVPQTHTEDMYSWFPLYIPLAQPVRVCRGQTVSAHLWRCVDSKKVWYEWCLSSPIRSSVQNSGGKVYSVGL